jgi:hypothetical protein
MTFLLQVFGFFVTETGNRIPLSGRRGLPFSVMDSAGRAAYDYFR